MGISPDQVHKIKTAVENTCELCHEYFPPLHLEVHLISRKKSRGVAKDPSSGILVVCRHCHLHIHTLPLPVKNQRVVARQRSFYARQDLRRILGYVPKQYLPPDTIDLSQVYEDYFSSMSYRLGG